MPRPLNSRRLEGVCSKLIEPFAAAEAVEALGWLAPWLLRPPVIEEARQEDPIYAKYAPHKLVLPCQPGGCWPMWVNKRQLGMVRDAGVLPLVWREGGDD